MPQQSKLDVRYLNYKILHALKRYYEQFSANQSEYLDKAFPTFRRKTIRFTEGEVENLNSSTFIKEI